MLKTPLSLPFLHTYDVSLISVHNLLKSLILSLTPARPPRWEFYVVNLLVVRYVLWIPTRRSVSVSIPTRRSYVTGFFRERVWYAASPTLLRRVARRVPNPLPKKIPHVCRKPGRYVTYLRIFSMLWNAIPCILF